MNDSAACEIPRARKATRSSSQPSRDRIAIPRNTPNLVALPGGAIARVERLEIPVFPVVATMSPPLHAGFYFEHWGPIPFVFGRVPPERYEILTIGSHFRLQ